MQVHTAGALTHRNRQESCFKCFSWLHSVGLSPGKSGRFPPEEQPSSASLAVQAERRGMLFAVRQQHPYPHPEWASVTLPEQHPGFAELTETLISWTGSSPGQGAATEG